MIPRVVIGGLLLLACGCAPLDKKTHFERWDEQHAQAKAEMAAEEEAKKRLLEMKSAPPAPAPAPGAAKVTPSEPPPPPPPPPSGDYNSLGGTPPIQTATKSRAIVPEEAEEPIY